MNLSTDIQVTVLFNAFSDHRRNRTTAVSLTLPDVPEGCAYESVETVAEALFYATNLQEGPVWEAIKDILPEGRTHTSLSVGDLVIVNGSVVRCDSIGWEVIA